VKKRIKERRRGGRSRVLEKPKEGEGPPRLHSKKRKILKQKKTGKGHGSRLGGYLEAGKGKRDI